MMTNLNEIPALDAFIVGIFLGVIITVIYTIFTIKSLKKDGYIILEPTQKLRDKFNEEPK